MVRSKPGLINCFQLGGVIKILETLAIFTCLMLHRIGAVGTQVFFGAADLVLDAADPDYPTEVDAEIIGKCRVVHPLSLAIFCYVILCEL